MEKVILENGTKLNIIEYHFNDERESNEYGLSVNFSIDGTRQVHNLYAQIGIDECGDAFIPDNSSDYWFWVDDKENPDEWSDVVSSVLESLIGLHEDASMDVIACR